MEKHTLTANKRTVTGRKVKQLRKQGTLPANIYGKKTASQNVQVAIKDFNKVFSASGETGLVELTLDGKKLPVLIHNLQYHPVSDEILHADFYQVDLKEKITAKIPLVLTGEAQAVKDKIGVLLTILSEIEVEALPADLPESIKVDVSGLSQVDQSFKVSGVKLDAKIKILTDPDLDIVKVATLVSKEAEKLAEEQAAASAAAATATAAQTGAVPAEGATAAKPVDTSAGKQPPAASAGKSGAAPDKN